MSIDINLTPDLYAITGENASGKSTVMASIASIFYPSIINKLLLTKEKSYINYQINYGSTFSLAKTSPDTFGYLDLVSRNSEGEDKLKINGFYEGSVAYGNRFRTNNQTDFQKTNPIDINDLKAASDFVKENLGFIIRNDPNHYSDLFFLPKSVGKEKYNTTHLIYFLKELNSYGIDELISQYSLSTGEHLIITLLHSLENYVLQRAESKDIYIVLLDEIEFGLHPSALKRLLSFLKELVKRLGIIVYFSSHSIELIRNIKSKNIYYLNKNDDKSITVINPCYPAYATRNIFEHDGYDCLILVEDELARLLINELLSRNSTKTNKLIHILPAGGWENVLSLHQEIIKSNMLGSDILTLTILDGDVEDKFRTKYLENGEHRNINVSFLPVQSLEKYLREIVIETPNYDQIKKIGDSLFTNRHITDVINEYKRETEEGKDQTGKRLLKYLLNELNNIGVSDENFYKFISNLIIEEVDTEGLFNRINRVLQNK